MGGGGGTRILKGRRVMCGVREWRKERKLREVIELSEVIRDERREKGAGVG